MSEFLSGFKVGHWSDADARTGCTVVIPPPGTVGSCDVRGSAPGSRETLVLDPSLSVAEVTALLLTGGSAFGLAAADGVVRFLEEQGLGYETPAARVPIVPAAVIYDLGVSHGARPGPDAGYRAAEAAVEGPVATGRVGAGTGATVGKYKGFEHGIPGGLGVAHAREEGQTVAALAVVNAVGDIVAPDGTVLAGTSADADIGVTGGDLLNTVLVVVATRATMSKAEAHYLAARGSDGITVAVRPAHTRFDGDICFALAAPDGEPVDRVALNHLGMLAARASAAAIRAAVS